MRRTWIDAVLIVVALGLTLFAGFVRQAARLSMARTYHFPWAHYFLGGLVWIAVGFVLVLPLWLALRRGGTAGKGYRVGLFLLYAIPGLLMVTALPLYYTGVGQPAAWLLQQLATYGSEALGGVMVGVGLLRATIRE